MRREKTGELRTNWILGLWESWDHVRSFNDRLHTRPSVAFRIAIAKKFHGPTCPRHDQKNL